MLESNYRMTAVAEAVLDRTALEAWVNKQCQPHVLRGRSCSIRNSGCY